MRIIDAQTVSVEVEWTEPVVNEDGTPLTDLAYSSVYYQEPNGPLISGTKVQAPVPTGGTIQKTSLILPLAVNERKAFSFQVSSTDTSGNEGPKTAPIVFTIDRVAPGVPLNFSVA